MVQSQLRPKSETFWSSAISNNMAKIAFAENAAGLELHQAKKTSSKAMIKLRNAALWRHRTKPMRSTC